MFDEADIYIYIYIYLFIYIGPVTCFIGNMVLTVC
jgi:hypothetical protein